ncbi:PAS domain S-box protein [Streptomyces ipomoeae]|uniref:PAS domain S-box protein n=1 Tax=Streptomyces ipomoeae TaxID=103232 RepID=UPI001FD10305|nr:PAS domain S-box protein [Streptomyces ipomoeae]MDX2939263.1 PAS domain S-box protein [Streptomyces ipomoeae]
MHRTGGPPGRRAQQLDQAHPVESVTIVVTDGDARVAYWSREVQELPGYTSAEIIDRPLDYLVSTDGATPRHHYGRLLGHEGPPEPAARIHAAARPRDDRSVTGDGERKSPMPALSLHAGQLRELADALETQSDLVDAPLAPHPDTWVVINGRHTSRGQINYAVPDALQLQRRIRRCHADHGI